MATSISNNFPLINLEQLKIIMPQARTQLLEMFLEEFNLQLPQFKINTPIRLSAFMAQGAYESGELRELVEIMFYSTSARLQQVWPKRFPTVDSTLPYLKNPEKLGNFVYANRMGNGDVDSGDGFKYRGRGWFNATGRDAYKKMTITAKHDFITFPDDLALPKFAVQSACKEWDENDLNDLADTDSFTKITKIINGGLTGLDGRLVYYHKAKIAFEIAR